MSELVFPAGFLWGTATAAHQVEGNNTNSDWWEWERRAGTPCKEPSGAAIDHYRKYPRDMAVLAGLGFNTYRFSVEWARIEPSEGHFDESEIDHYRKMVALCHKTKLTPMVTLNHFTLPKWVADRGGWLTERTPVQFERYVKKVVTAFGDQVDWYCTINEPGVVAFGGYLGALGFPPGTTGLDNWTWATKQLIHAHQLARKAIKEIRPTAMVGMTHSMQEWESNEGGKSAMEYARRMGEDIYLDACKDDDFIGVQTYTRARVELPRAVGMLAGPALKIHAIERFVVSQMVKRTAAQIAGTKTPTSIEAPEAAAPIVSAAPQAPAPVPTAAEPVTTPEVKPARKRAVKPAATVVAAPVAAPVAKSAAKPVAAAKPAAKVIAKPVVKAAAPAAKPAAKPRTKRAPGETPPGTPAAKFAVSAAPSTTSSVADAPEPEGVRLTQMGYEFRPQAIAATVRRVAQLMPGKPIVVTEHGIATADDIERVEFITEGLKALHALIAEGIPLRGYIHWSAFDNFEWDRGYDMQFGLIAVDRATQVREPKPSAQFLGRIARANKLKVQDK